MSRIEVSTAAFNNDLLSAALRAYLDRALPSALLGRLLDAVVQVARDEDAQHLREFYDRLAALKQAELDIENAKFCK